MNAILTKVLPATDTKPTRIKAYTEGGNSCITSWSACDQPGSAQAQAHLFAAQQLCKKMHWWGALVGGGRW